MIIAQSCALIVKWAHAAASLRVVPPPRNEQGVTENSCVPRSVVNNDDGVPVALSQNVMTKHGDRREGATLGAHTKVWPYERADAESVGESGDRECATPWARGNAVPIEKKEQGGRDRATPGARAYTAPSLCASGPVTPVPARCLELSRFCDLSSRSSVISPSAAVSFCNGSTKSGEPANMSA